jgi:hypothetical protein
MHFIPHKTRGRMPSACSSANNGYRVGKVSEDPPAHARLSISYMLRSPSRFADIAGVSKRCGSGFT